MSGRSMVPFYAIILVHALLVVFNLFILPESLSSEARSILAKDVRTSMETAKRREAAERQWENETPSLEISDPLLVTPRTGESGRTGVSVAGRSKYRKRAAGNARRLVRKMFQFLHPVAIFLPRDREDGNGKDYTMTFMGCALFCMSMMYVSAFFASKKGSRADSYREYYT